MTVLVVFTQGDQRIPEVEGGRRPRNAPATMHALFELRAHELRPTPSADVQSFDSVAALVSFLEERSNEGRTYDEIVFVGHGGPGVFSLAGVGVGTVRHGTFRSSNRALISFTNPDRALIQALAAASPLITSPVRGDGSVTGVRVYRSLNIHTETCRIARNSFGAFLTALRHENVSASVSGYSVTVKTIFRGDTEHTDIVPAPPNQFHPISSFWATQSTSAGTFYPVQPRR